MSNPLNQGNPNTPRVVTPQVSTPNVVTPTANYGLPTDGKAKNWGVAGLILAFFIPLIGAILSHVSLNKFKHQQSQVGRGIAVAGAIIGWLHFALQTIYVVIAIATVMMLPSMQNIGVYS